VFAGGIGEQASVVRARICSELEFLGIEIEEQSNAQNADVISTKTGRVAVRVIHTDEEVMIAKSACGVLRLTTQKEHGNGNQDENA
jgi:acetate kinase